MYSYKLYKKLCTAKEFNLFMNVTKKHLKIEHLIYIKPEVKKVYTGRRQIVPSPFLPSFIALIPMHGAISTGSFSMSTNDH